MDDPFLERLRKGDLNAFSQMVEEHQNFAFSVAFRVVKKDEDAEEVAQDAFVKAYRSIGTFNGRSKFSTWLFRIVYNTAVSRVRGKRLQYESIEDHHESIDCLAVRSAMDDLEAKERREIIDAVLDALPHDESTILALYYLEEFTVKEISETLELSTSNVKVRLFRARKRFYAQTVSLLQEEVDVLR